MMNSFSDFNLVCRLIQQVTAKEADILVESMPATSRQELAPFLPFLPPHGTDDVQQLLSKLILAAVCLRGCFSQNKGADYERAFRAIGSTVLLVAAEDNTLDDLLFFLQAWKQTDIVNAQNSSSGKTALHGAHVHPQAVKLLLEHGADPNIRDHGRCTPLYWAARSGNTESAAVLWKYGASVHDVDGNSTTVLMVAAMYSTDYGTEVLRYFLEDGNCTDILNAQDLDGGTAVHYAYDEPQALELLLQHGADPSIEDDEGLAPLHVCASFDSRQAAVLLLEHGADLNLKDHQKKNAMHHAVVNGNLNFVQWLLEVGAQDQMFARDRFGRTPLDEAFRQLTNGEQQHHEQQCIIHLLVEQNQRKMFRQEGGLCLHWILRAAIYRKGTVVLPIGTFSIPEMLEFLAVFVSKRPDLISTGDDTGALPLHIACQRPKTPIQLIEFLVEQDPSTVHQTDTTGNWPLHSLCASRPSLHKVKYLLDRDSKSGMALNNHAHSPFEVASLASASVEVLWYLMKVDPVVALASDWRSC